MLIVLRAHAPSGAFPRPANSELVNSAYLPFRLTSSLDIALKAACAAGGVADVERPDQASRDMGCFRQPGRLS